VGSTVRAYDERRGEVNENSAQCGSDRERFLNPGAGALESARLRVATIRSRSTPPGRSRGRLDGLPSSQCRACAVAIKACAVDRA
jgi:hypothetical protein